MLKRLNLENAIKNSKYPQIKYDPVTNSYGRYDIQTQFYVGNRDKDAYFWVFKKDKIYDKEIDIKALDKTLGLSIHCTYDTKRQLYHLNKVNSNVINKVVEFCAIGE